MSYAKVTKNIDIDEGTTHEIEVSLTTQDYVDLMSEGFEAVFTSISETDKIEKRCVIDGNLILVILDPVETLIPSKYRQSNAFERDYQIRIFNDNTTYQVCSGILKIHKAHKNYTSNPLDGKG